MFELTLCMFSFAWQWCHSLLSSSSPFLPIPSHPHPFSFLCESFSPHTSLTHPHPPQVPVPVVLQRRPDAVGELGLQHRGSPTSCPPSGQHHPAWQRASSAVDRQALLLLHYNQGAPLVCLPAQKPTHQHWTNLHSALQTKLLWTADINQRRRRESVLHRPLQCGGDLNAESLSHVLHFTLWHSVDLSVFSA